MMVGAFRRPRSRHPHVVRAAAVALVSIVVSICGLAEGRPTVKDSARAPIQVSILVYHRFGLAVRDSMTIRTSTLVAQLKYLQEHRYPIIPLRTLVAYLNGETSPPPPRSVVITVDDGHESVYADMLPVVRDYRIPVTLFIYPSAISNASYAMTWDQLRTLSDTGLFDIQSHTYWHPNFAIERRRLAPAAYRAFAAMQFCRSKSVLHDRLGVTPSVLAWPFGVYDEDLFSIARDCGYVAAVTLDRRLVTARDALMALPRFLVTDTALGARFAAMLPPEVSP
jgi:peptidoglycan/xylan/chitin deacetylase (PgdA/CDA1 family)